jgi:hypothetical protein
MSGWQPANDDVFVSVVTLRISALGLIRAK